MRLPPPRGPLSTAVLSVLAGSFTADDISDRVALGVSRVHDPCSDADLQVALAACYELHYRGFDKVSDDLEWDPGLIGLRRLLERSFEDAVRALSPRPSPEPTETIGLALRRLVDTFNGPSLSAFLLRDASLEQFRELVVERSVYQLKEADPHTWALPRLHGRAKAALVEIQFDEYGGGRPGRMHAELFAQTMRALELDDTYGAYWPVVAAETFAFTNLMSLRPAPAPPRGVARPAGSTGDGLDVAEPALCQRSSSPRPGHPGHCLLRRARGG